MAIKHLAGERIIGTTAERAALSGTTPTAIQQTSWKVLDRASVSGSSSGLMDTGTFAEKDNLMILSYIIGDRTGNETMHPKLQFNGDDGTNYTSRFSTNGGSEALDPSSGSTSATAMRFGAGTSTTDQFIVTTIRNNASNEKFAITHMTFQAGGTLGREETVGKWANVNDKIESVQVIDSYDHMADGSEVVVLGCDDDETDSGTNFWQEIGTDKLTVAGDVLTTGDITAKKYLMINTHHLGDITSGTSANVDYNMTFNDSTSGYTTVQSQSGAADGSPSSGSFINGWIGYQDRFNCTFMVNPATKDKLAIAEDTGGIVNYGAGTAPVSNEWGGEWDNDSQIDKVTVTNSSARSGAYGVGSSLKVWGSN